MDGVTTTGTGLTGNWAVANGGASASSAYVATGLTFGDSFTTSGGALRLTAASNQTAFVGAALATPTTPVTGNLWSSYLVSFTTLVASANGSSTQRLNTAGATSTAAGDTKFLSLADGPNTAQPAVDYAGNTGLTSSNFTLTVNTTYLIVSKFTNVGTLVNSGNPGVASQWVFTQTQYENWLAGGAVEAQLGSFASSSITQSHTVSGTNTFAGYAQFGNWAQGAGNTQTVVFDELRYGTTLADVMATIPEPAAFALLLGFGSLGCAALHRRRVR